MGLSNENLNELPVLLRLLNCAFGPNLTSVTAQEQRARDGVRIGVVI
jgi:hypothetical protein